MTGQPNENPDAKTRLTGIRTQEVSLVDHAANLTEFAIKKNLGSQMDEPKKKADDAPPAPPPPAPAAAPPPAGGDAPAMVLPQAAKDDLLQGLAAALDALTKYAEQVKAAQVDDTATVSQDVAEGLEIVAEMLLGMAEKYEPAGSATTMAAPPPAPAVEGEQKAADADPVATAKRRVATAKAGRKMSSGRLSMLRQAAGILAAIVGEVETDAVAAAPSPATSPASAPAAAPPAPVAVAKGAAPAMSPELEAVLSKLTKGVTDALDVIKKNSETHAAVQKAVSEAITPSNAGPDNGAPPPVKKSTTTAWPQNLAEEARLEMQEERQKAQR